jgi:hypothetical protein
VSRHEIERSLESRNRLGSEPAAGEQVADVEQRRGVARIEFPGERPVGESGRVGDAPVRERASRVAQQFVRGARDLGVESQQVVPIDTQTADGWTSVQR